MKKKLITSLMFVVMAFAFPICLISCGGAKVSGIYVKEGTYETEVDHKSNAKSLDVLSGAEIYAKLSNGTERQVSLDDVEVSDLNTGTVGKTTIKLTYAGFTYEVKVNVVKTIVKIEPTTELKSTYKQNESFGDIALKVTYSDSSTETILSGFEVSGSTASVGVNKELKITYKGKVFTHSFNVEHYVVSFEITSFAPSVFYSEDYSYSSIAIKVKYSDNAEEVINYNSKDFAVEINTNEVGKQALKVTYAEITNEKEVEVLAKLLSVKYESGLGTEKEGDAYKVSSYTQIKAIKLTAKFNDNSGKEISFDDLSDCTIDYNVKGETQEVQLEYTENGITQSYTIEIYLTEDYTAEGQKVISKIEITEGAIENLIHGRVVSTPTITATYDDNSTEDVSSKVSIICDENFNKVPTGQNSFNSSITYKFRGKEAKMEFVVWNLPSKIELVGLNTNLEYGDTFTYPGVKVHFLNGDVKETTAGELTGLTTNNIYTEVVGGQYLKYTYTTSYETPYKDNQELNYNNDTLEERKFVISKQVIITINDVSKGLKIVGLGDEDNIYSVVQNKSLDFDSIEVYEEFESGKMVRLYKGVDYEVTALDTTTLGEKTITFTKISDNTIKKEVRIQVISGYTTTSFTAPSFVTLYNSNKANQNTYDKTGSTGIKGFTETNKTYIVGSANPFVFAPIMLAKPVGEEKSIIVSDYSISAKVYIKNGTDYSELTGEDLAKYVSINETSKTFQFTELANGKEFKIEVTPENGSSDFLVTFEFKVINGYNVYNADDLSVVDNTNMGDKWNTLKSTNKISTDLNISAVILHNDISIRKENLPENHFYKEGDVVNDIALNKNDIDYDRALGSLKDSGSVKDPIGAIYTRTLKAGETFTMEGNYFKISIQDMPLIVRGDGKVSETLDKAITTHTTLFRFIPEKNQNGDFAGDYTTTNINNVAFYGNSKKSEIPALSGGMMCMKADSTNLNLSNCLSQAWFISFMIEGNNDYADNIQAKFYKTNAYDAYNTLLYVWAGRNVVLEECKFIGAGGPVMIVDHVDNNENTGEGGYISNVTNKNSTLESWVAGTEGWFVTYGATALVTQMSAFDAMFRPMGITITKDGKLNLISVYKSGSAEGLTNSQIRGSFSDVDCSYSMKFNDDKTLLHLAYQTGLANLVKRAVWNQLKQAALAQHQSEENAEAYANANVYTKTIEYLMSDNSEAKVYKEQLVGGIRQFGSRGMFMETDSGAVAFPNSDGTWYKDSNYGFDGTPNQDLIKQAKKYMYVYLFNGMGANLGIEKISNTND